MAPKAHLPEKIARMREMRKARWAYARIAAELRCSKDVVRRLCEDVPMDPAPPRYTEETAQRVVETYSSGLTLTATGKRCEISRDAVREILRKHQVPMRKSNLGTTTEKGELEAAFDRICKGESYASVARDLGIKGDTLRRRFEQRGWIGGLGMSSVHRKRLDDFELRRRKAFLWFGEEAERMVRKGWLDDRVA